MKIRLLLAVVIVFLTASHSYAEYYRYVDKKTGQVWVTNIKPDISQANVEVLDDAKKQEKVQTQNGIPGGVSQEEYDTLQMLGKKNTKSSNSASSKK